MVRIARWISVFGLLFATLALAPVSASDGYQIVARLPNIMDGHPIDVLRFDPVSHRLFAGNLVGLYSADLSVAKPKMTGPLTSHQTPIRAIDVAPDLGRVFYAGVDEIGYVDQRHGQSVKMSGNTSWSLAYEPTTHEVYAAYGRSPEIEVFDGGTGRHLMVIKVPGWNAFGLQAIPGTVFLFVGGRDGIYAINPQTHEIAPWKVNGSLTTPGNLEVDPSGRYLFLARSREIDAIDVATRTVTGRLPMYGTASIGFDPSAGLLVAAWPDLSEQRDELTVLRPTGDGLTTVATLKNDAGGTRIMRMNYGFIQEADREFLVWGLVRHPTAR